MEEQPRSLRSEQVIQTRAALVAAGRALFGRNGFAGTSVEELARQARVTTGALYHHFPNKTALFEAVFELLHQESMGRSVAAASEVTDPLEALAIGADAFLGDVLEPSFQQILIVDAPAVLGLARFTELDERYAFPVMVALLDAARISSRAKIDDAETLARLLIGALTRGAMLIANSATPEATRMEVSASYRSLLRGLLSLA